MNWKVENVPELKGYTVEWAEKNNFYLSKRNVVFHSENLKPPFKKIAEIDAPFVEKSRRKFSSRAKTFTISGNKHHSAFRK